MRPVRIAPLLAPTVIFPIICSLPAQARPQDEVMSGVFRCASIDDARMWLDCYYGAAQPARASLGLPPAAEAQIRLVSSPPLGSSAPQAIEIRNTVLAAAFNCRSVEDERQWLNCYYAAAQPMRAELGLPPAPQSNSTSHPRETASSVSTAISNSMPSVGEGVGSAAGVGNDFGLIGDSGRLSSVTSRMASYEFDKEGIFTVTLSNGQIWGQIPGDTTNSHWKGPAQKYQVHISRGFLGSFNLQVRNLPGLYKVHRLR